MNFSIPRTQNMENKSWVANDISFPELLRVRQKPVQPLQADAAHPRWRFLHGACVDSDGASADAPDNGVRAHYCGELSRQFRAGCAHAQKNEIDDWVVAENFRVSGFVEEAGAGVNDFAVGLNRIDMAGRCFTFVVSHADKKGGCARHP